MTILQLLLDIVNYKVQGKCYLFFFFFFPSEVVQEMMSTAIEGKTLK